MKLIPEGVTDPGLKSAYRGAEKHNWSKEELEAYWKMKMRDEIGIVRLAVEEAEARKEKEKIRALAEKEEEMTLKLLDSGLPMENISKITGLTIKEIEDLKNRKSCLQCHLAKAKSHGFGIAFWL